MFVPEPTPELATVIQQPAQQTEVPKVKKPRKPYGFYFAPKYMFLLGGLTALGGGNAEIGWTYKNRMLFGIDLNVGMNFSDGSAIGGGGFSLGRVYDLPVPQMQLAYGGGVGLWYVVEWRSDYGSLNDNNGSLRDNINFLAPFIRFRWKFLELSYRGLLGMYSKEICRDYKYYDDGGGFAWNNNQIMLGLYFGGR
jgi:hypothetical protein